jgi:branched-chain amino acid transport system permease protein
VNLNSIRHGAVENRWLIAILAVLTVFPFVAPMFIGSFYTVLMIEAMIFAIFALGYDIMMGYTGMISFGHAAYFGLGVYGGALTILHLSEGLIPLLLVAVVLSAAFAFIVGYFSLRSTGVYFALITFAFAQVLYEIVIRSSDFLGGNNGLTVPKPTLFAGIEISEMMIYYLVLLTMVAVYVGARRLINSPLGLIFQVIGENENRAEFIGYNVDRYKHISFIISGMVSGLAGGLFVAAEGFASPDLLFWLFSGEIIIIVIFGGVGTLYGPMIGAVVFIYLETYLNSTFDAWQIILGLVFIAVVLLFPQGLVGLLQNEDSPDSLSLERLRDKLPSRD